MYNDSRAGAGLARVGFSQRHRNDLFFDYGILYSTRQGVVKGLIARPNAVEHEPESDFD